MRRANVLLLVTGGIAAYKACFLTRLLVQAGFSVRVAMTGAAQRFVSPLTLEVLSENRVGTDLWREGGSEPLDHVRWSDWADLAVVAPATANFLAKAACGIADDLVTSLLVAFPGRLILAPGMNDNMWRHPATRANLATLRERGAVICEPTTGPLACGSEGPGRMAEPEDILAVVRSEAGLLSPREPAPSAADPAAESPWLGQRVVVTAGPTFEPVDPVRYLANRSTGVFGYALAAEAARLGAEVTLVSGPTPLAPPVTVERFVPVETAAEMAGAVEAALNAGADWLFMAAAVADFTPVQVEGGKLKKETLGTSWRLELKRTVDILADVVPADRPGGLQVVGFALETEDLLERAAQKRRAKGLDFIIANDPAAGGFGDREHQIHLIGSEGVLWESGSQLKSELASGLFARLAPFVHTAPEQS